ncbi:MAG: penicillin acylase family protein [Pseudomonadota bacterium]
MRVLTSSIALVAAATTAVIGTAAYAQDEPQYDATITRTTYNIAHVESETWGGVGYGVAFAYAEDNICMLAEEFATLAGTRSYYFGPDNSAVLGFTTVDNLTSDIFFRARLDLEALAAGWEEQSQTARDLVDGYVAGYNRFLRDTGAENLPEACRDAAWVKPITRDDMLRLNEKQMLLASSLALAPGIAMAAPPGSEEASAEDLAVVIEPHEDLTFGSNGWAFGGDATADGSGLLIGNPHFPWAGPSRFWQVHIKGPDGYHVMGTGLAGTPIVTLGFNKDIAWTHTVTAARHFTLYALTLASDDPTVYIVDGERREMESTTVSVPMPDGADPVERTLYSTDFGPVVTLPGTPMAWSEQLAFTLRDANAGNQRAIDTWVGIGMAKNVQEIEDVISASLGIPWVNTIAADRDGNALHADITAVPGVSAEFIASCGTPFSGLVADRVTLLDGTRSQCNWREAGGSSTDGLLPAEDQASRIRRDYVTNSNDSYWISNPAEPYRQLSPILGDFEEALTLRSRSNYLETEATLAAARMDHARAKELVFGNKSLAADMVVEPVLALCEGAQGLEDACAALAGWDREFELDSKAAYLFAAFWEKVRSNGSLWSVPFDASDPINTPHTLQTDGANGEALLTALGEAGSELEAAGIALDARWGDVHAYRVTVDGEARAIPLHGGPGVAGVLNMQRGRPVEGGIHPVHGSSYIQIVGFGEDGPVADAILSYSQSTDPNSPHFSDQTEIYSTKTWHRLPFDAEAIEAAQTGEAMRLIE